MTSLSPEAHSLTGAYVLDSLDPRDRAEVETHLADCPTCTREVAEFRAVAAILGEAVPETPPPALRGAVLHLVGQTRQLPPVLPERDSPGNRRQRRLTIYSIAASVAAVIALAGLGVVGAQTVDQRNQLAAERSRTAELTTVVSAAAARSAQPMTGGGSIAVIPFGDRLYVAVRDLPPLPEGRVYQLWMSTPDGVKSAGLVDGTAGQAERVLQMRADKDSVDSVKVTVEPKGGSKQPTTAVIGTAAVRG
ncbi:anti-sigma factor [Frankia sp. CNm7]|uniref:Regulator of SigK n=1 Tax=Frankia nepalensis TaxID=1836974 RepID=A0A937URF2_9ACTN|nr:anti-sigma factor [Frankia nepalensis]MBL7499968.1 anti-sigma factor [Frankia nepalensis]MBL7512501.1 anti-sigma factor [Frankia nepalensis]MBL7517446.1 anti-sigma factor [Frankia nepalensis]MBL7632804.1 anti-sigma factor [Frankia nepalensis]